MTTADLDAIYAEMPNIECQQRCQECCGPIAMSGPEWDRIVAHLGYTPRSRPGCETCPILSLGGLCHAHSVRPAICRLWGLVPSMACPHGCQPERWLTEEECFSFLLRTGVYGAPMPREKADEVAQRALAMKDQPGPRLQVARAGREGAW